MPKLTETRLTDLLNLFPNLHIGVIGDLALDAYWHADMTRAYLSRETPHFPKPIVRESYTCGAGANVAHNLKVLGVGRVTVFSILGDDWRGELLQNIMSQHSIDCSQLLKNTQRNTTAYIKPILMGYESQQEDARIDFVNTFQLSETMESEILHKVKTCLLNVDAFIVVDQLEVNGIITHRVREGLNALASENRDKLFLVDSRVRIGSFKHMVLKPNKHEAISALKWSMDPNTTNGDDLFKVAETLSNQARGPVYLTLGEKGVLVYADGCAHLIPAGPVTPPLDPVGAGDAFISALAGALSVGAAPREAGYIANLAAAVTVEKLNQTGTASPAEILARYRRAASDCA
jgi:rfaE bifunctional protein kinase chain/domain